MKWNVSFVGCFVCVSVAIWDSEEEGMRGCGVKVL
jgi:hypothetical protein